MSKVRILVGTRKGAFVLTSDGKRQNWNVSGPHFAGWEMYHLKGSPVNPNRIYASQTSGWFGQIIQRSDDGGKTWIQPGTPPGEKHAKQPGPPKGESNKFVYDTSAETGKPLTTHMWYDGTQHPWEFKRVWHIEPSLTDADTVYAARPTAERTGRNWRDCAVTVPARAGNPAPAACACTPSFWIRKILSGSTLPSRPQVRSAPTTAAIPGSRSTKASTPNTFPNPRPKSATAFITLR